MGFFEVFAGALAAFYALIPSYGLAIVLLTVAVRLLLLPLSIKQTKSMREMQVIQPEVKKLQTKYKSDPKKRNEEMMKLYKEHGVNPFGGCLPLLMQMPLFIGLYQVIRFNLRYMGYTVTDSVEGFEQITDAGVVGTLANSKLAEDLLNLGSRETVNQFLPGMRLDCSFLEAWRGVDSVTVESACGTGSPFVAMLPYALLIGLMGFTTYYQQRQMMSGRGAQDQQAQQMQMIMRFMPILLVAFAIGIPIGPGFPAGVVLYWVTTNLWTIVQQRIILAKFGPMPSAAAPAGKPPAKDNATKSNTKKSSAAKGKQAANGGKKRGAATPTTAKPTAKKQGATQSGNGAKSKTTSGASKKKRRK